MADFEGDVKVIAIIVHEPVLEDVALADVVDELFAGLEIGDQMVDGPQCFGSDGVDGQAGYFTVGMGQAGAEFDGAAAVGVEGDRILLMAGCCREINDAQSAGADVDGSSHDGHIRVSQDRLAKDRYPDMDTFMDHAQISMRWRSLDQMRWVDDPKCPTILDGGVYSIPGKTTVFLMSPGFETNIWESGDPAGKQIRCSMYGTFG